MESRARQRVSPVYLQQQHVGCVQRVCVGVHCGAVLVASSALLFCAGLLCSARAQTPVLLPGTISAIAGSAPASTTVGGACATNSPFTAVDVYGDGCPAVNAVFQNTETSIAVDPAGNVYLSNNSANQIVRRIDARTGLIARFAGYAASQCASGAGTTIYGTKVSQTDKTGDNCPVSSSYGFNGPVSLGVDPYGNVLMASTGDLNLHMVCNAISPACSAAAVGENLMITVAGCSTSATSYGVAESGQTPGTAGDGHISFQTGGGSCSSSAGGVAGRIYGVVADKWDNIYFADAGNLRFRVVAGAASIVVNGITLTNPLYATLETSTTVPNNYATVTQGFVYPIAGGGTVCSGNTDAYGDGCPFTQTLTNTSSSGVYMQGVAVDNEGDFIFADGNGRLRVIYEGGTVIKGALAAVGIATPQLGYSYALIAGTTGAINYNSGNPGLVLGSKAALQASAIQTLAVDPAGNIVIGDQIQVLFYDIATGYVRRLGTSNGYAAPGCTPEADAFGDGCSLAQSTYGATNKALYVSEDGLGNLYLLDTTNHLIRRVAAQTLPTTAVNGSLTSSLTVHAPAAGSSVAVTAAAGSDFTVGTPSCTTNSTTDNSVDCTATLTYAPKTLAQRNDAVSVATTVGGVMTTQNIGLNALATGSALVFDTQGTPNTAVYGAAATGSTAIVMDGAGNAYVSGAQGISKITPGGTVRVVTGTAANFIAVDTQGNVYATAGNTTTIAKYSYAASTGAYTASSIAIPVGNVCTAAAASISCATTQVYSGPLVVDAAGIIYVVDQTNLQAFKFAQSGLLVQQLTQTKFASPTAVAQDSFGNLLVLDGTTVLEVPAAGYPVLTTSPTANLPLKLAASLTAPTGIAVDQAENVYIADTVSGVNTVKVQTGSNFAQTASNYQYTLPGVTGTALAVDGAGNLYVTASPVAGITQVLRSAQSFVFGTNVTISDAGAFLNAGGSNATGFSQTDTTTDFTESAPTTPFASGASTCNIGSSVLLSGGICNVAFTFSPTANGNGDTPNTITLLPSANTLGSLYLDGTKSGSTATTTTVISGNTTGLVYTTGTETSFTVTVSESPAAIPTGTVAVSIDNGTAVNYTLTQTSGSTATATVAISGLSATTHSIYAAYAASSGIAGSNSGNVAFSIASTTTAVAWTPGATSLPYSAAVGTSVLNASSSSPAKSGSIPGVFIYTATPTTGGSAQNIHSASYLAIGSYNLGVTFVPNDAVDYQQSTTTAGTLTITQATTTAGLGATQAVVAADGTGNYTSVQAAVNALPNGGSIYIKPGTYTGDITVVQPNIAFRGLGGDPTKVILTHEGGAFSNNGGVYQYSGEFNTSISNGYQLPSGSSLFSGDEGSATLVVAKGINTSLSTATQTPNGFYAENLSLINGYNTDSSTTTTTYVSGGNCVAGNGTAYSYTYLYNAGIQCASQALAIWTTSDLAVMNNVFATSQQDTVYAASPGSGSNGYVPTRQYWFRGKISGDVDFLFGDAAAVFDSTSIYTTWHGNTATGTETIEAQNQAVQTGAANAYLSGYIMNDVVFTSQSTGMTALYFGRPYGTYSTWVMLNSYIDQVNATGYTTGLGPALTYATYLEYNDIPYTDPATNGIDLNGVAYLGAGGNSGSGVTGTREASSGNTGTPSAVLSPPVSLTQAYAQAYFPTNFLSQTVASVLSSTTNWNPTAALATQVNAFTGTGNSASIAGGSSVTILMRPQTPGLGAIVPTSYSSATPTPVVFTIPTGTYTLSDTFGGNTSILATGSLDASGEASFTSAALIAGTHSLTWTYSGDGNFAGSNSAAYVVAISGTSTTTSLSGAGVQYGQAASIMATVGASSGTPTGNVTLTIDGSATQTQALASGVTVFSVTGLSAGNHSFSASYAGASTYTASATTSNLALAVSQAPLQATSSCANRIYDHPNVCSVSVTGYQYTDSAATVFAGTPSVITVALPNSPMGMYSDAVSATLSSFGSTNYALTSIGGNFTVSGGAPQNIVFAPLPNFVHGGSYQLTAYTTSGLPIVYSMTGSSATVSGSTLTVTGTGSVTVTASSSTDPTGDYAMATAVPRSFIAQ
jgi:pectin methylesterase-like acyl-CoA thioesterase